MSLPWVRLESNIMTHDKIIALLGMKDGHRAALVYVFSLAWSGGQGTDGHVPRAALPLLSGTEKHARMLIETRLWEYADGENYRIRNFDLRQELNIVAEGKRAARQAAARKGNCIKYHGPECGCWRTGE